MKQIKFLITIFLTSLFLCGCSVLYFSSKIRQIQKGMSPDQVVQLLGEPSNRRFDSEGEQWEYKRFNSETNVSYIIIDFADNRVVAMNTFDTEMMKHPVANPPIVTTPPIGGPTFPVHRGTYDELQMNDREFDYLCNKIKKEPFDDKKMEIAEIGTINSYFTCLQCRKMILLFTFTEEKMKVIQLFRGKIIDRQNIEQITDCFPFESEKETVRRVILSR